ncbi:MAG: oxidoreductase [Dehalococcoidales bacterium]|jgi:Fe-S-cluster-containing dehydrogenase component
MPRNGLLIQYDWCTGCHACEVACKQEHNYSEGMCGIRVDEVVSASPEKVYVDFVPITTRFCDLCADRVKRGEQTACVKHCQATCITYGPVAHLVKAQEKQPRSALWAPK